jgi:hypothetical protein
MMPKSPSPNAMGRSSPRLARTRLDQRITGIGRDPWLRTAKVPTTASKPAAR